MACTMTGYADKNSIIVFKTVMLKSKRKKTTISRNDNLKTFIRNKNRIFTLANRVNSSYKPLIESKIFEPLFIHLIPVQIYCCFESLALVLCTGNYIIGQNFKNVNKFPILICFFILFYLIQFLSRIFSFRTYINILQSAVARIIFFASSRYLMQRMF